VEDIRILLTENDFACGLVSLREIDIQLGAIELVVLVLLGLFENDVEEIADARLDHGRVLLVVGGLEDRKNRVEEVFLDEVLGVGGVFRLQHRLVELHDLDIDYFRLQNVHFSHHFDDRVPLHELRIGVLVLHCDAVQNLHHQVHRVLETATEGVALLEVLYPILRQDLLKRNEKGDEASEHEIVEKLFGLLGELRLVVVHFAVEQVLEIVSDLDLQTLLR